MPTPTKLIINLLYEYVPGTYDGYSVAIVGPMGQSPISPPYTLLYDNTAQASPTVVSSSPPITGSAAATMVSNLLSGLWVLNFCVFGTLAGSSVPYDEFKIYYCWLCVTYDDGSAAELTPTSYQQILPGGGNSTIVNPGNAVDTDPTSFASVRQIVYGSGGTAKAYLGVSNFVSTTPLSSYGCMSISCGNPPTGVLGSPYSHLFPVLGGTAPFTFVKTAGSFPTGLTLNATTGVVSGTPTVAGVFRLTIQVTDANSRTDSVSCSIPITGASQWIIQEVQGELIPRDKTHPDNPNFPGLYRYTVRCINEAQAGTYLGFWESFGGGGGGSSISSGVSTGNLPPGPPGGPPVGNPQYAHNDVIVASEPELSLNDGRLIGVTVVDDSANAKVDATFASTADHVSLKTANYLIIAADDGSLLSFNSGSALTATVPATPPPAPWYVEIQDIGAGALTLAHNGNVIDTAAADITLNTNQGLRLYSNGTNYYTERGGGGGGTRYYIATIFFPGTYGAPPPPIFQANIPGSISVAFSANLAGSSGVVVANPTSTASMTVVIGATTYTVSISTGGVVTFSGSAMTTSGDTLMTVNPPSTPDATLAGVGLTIIGKIL